MKNLGKSNSLDPLIPFQLPIEAETCKGTVRMLAGGSFYSCCVIVMMKTSRMAL